MAHLGVDRSGRVCVERTLGPEAPLMAEDLSLVTAGLAAYAGARV
jgi:hypothetical protein